MMSNSSSSFGPESEKESVMSYAKFVELHDAEMEDFLAMVDFQDIKKVLHENGSVLLHEHSQSYALLSCLEDEMNGFHDKMKRTARNSQILSHISELATSLKRHPRDVVLPFFDRVSNSSFRKSFDEAVDSFIDRIQKRAVEKRKEMDAESSKKESLSKEERIGPGGLDPVEVFESLPESLQDAFEKKDVAMLQVALEAMPIDEAQKHMARCEASGLWVSKKDDDDKQVVESFSEDDDDDAQDDDDDTAAKGGDDDDLKNAPPPPPPEDSQA
mmetsp:Transcript_22941/g.73776  ORF Transcript_22941/g.73776 Transcript_22941/m.73776 type:complete len:272 (-) Transcript_22941:844-1659(-)